MVKLQEGDITSPAICQLCIAQLKIIFSTIEISIKSLVISASWSRRM